MKRITLASFLFVVLYSSVNSANAGYPSATGDVIGRDLSAGTMWWLGHAGLWSGSRVIEALNHPTQAVQSNTFASFKNADDYWGARYWKNVTSQQLRNTVNTASTQGAYGSSYTYTPFVKPTVNRKPALFRCDSLVAYSYYIGTGKWYPETLPIANKFGSTPAQVYWYTGITSGGSR